MKAAYVGALATAAIVIAAIGHAVWRRDDPAASAVTAPRPNILLIMADDLGYSDIGAYGGEITTPHLDRLAQEGVLFSNFHAQTNCSPTRAMLFSGVDSHLAGLGTMAGYQTTNQKGRPGYEGYLNSSVLSFGTLLQDAGYRTYMTGKWHLGLRDDQLPNRRGFEKTYVLAEGSADHFDPEIGSLSIIPKPNYRKNGAAVTPPKENFYSSTFYTDALISFLQEDKGSAKPFLAVLSFTAPHWPLQAPAAYQEKYAKIYEAGYEAIRQKRLEKQISLGLVAPATVPAAQNPVWPKWQDLSPKEQAAEARRMQTYAAMVEAMDHEIGRLLAYLDQSGALDNTLVIFMSDNGAEGGNPIDLRDNRTWLPQHFDLSTRNTDKSASYTSYGPGWAYVSATPFRLYKSFPTEGGTRIPAIMSYPAKFKGRRVAAAFASVLDIAPTLYEVAGIDYPGAAAVAGTFPALQGASLVPYLADAAATPHDENYVMGWELWDRKAIRQGDWKLIALNKPWGQGEDNWLLYNLAQDPGEQDDLAARMPEKVAAMKELWEQYAQRNGVIKPDDLRLVFSNSLSHYKDSETFE